MDTEKSLESNYSKGHSSGQHPVATSGTSSQPLPSQFLTASPFVPSFLRDSHPDCIAEPSPPMSSNPTSEMAVSPPRSGSPPPINSMTSDQYSMLVEWLPGEIQDLLQVNLSHLQATCGGVGGNDEDDDTQQSLRLRAAAATFDQLSMDQLNEVNNVWNALFGEASDGAVVDGDPESVFAFIDDGLMPDEEEWFFSQMMQQNPSAKGTTKGSKRGNAMRKHPTSRKQ